MVTDLLHRDFPGSITPLNRDWRERCFRHMEVLATKFQVISDFTASRLIELYRVSPDRIFRTYEAIQGRFSGPRSIRRRVFVYPANFWVHKNHEVLLSAYKLYVQNLEEKAWSLALTGAPDDRQRLLKRLANDLGLEGRVRFLGYLPERELFEVLASASCLVFPSLYEGFGIPLIEAMSLEVPILCSREGSIPEIVRDAALYVNGRNPGELAQAMAEMTLRPALRTSLIEAGKRRLRDFDFPREVETLAEALSGAALSNDEITPIQAARRFLWCLRWDLWYYSRSLATKVRLLLGALARIPKFLS